MVHCLLQCICAIVEECIIHYAGVLDNEELFAIACDTPMDQSMPELNSLWDGPPGHLNASLESVPNSLVMKKGDSRSPHV